MRRFTTALLTSICVTLAAVVTTPVAAADQWLYVLAADDIRVVPGKGDAARVVVHSNIEAIQFTDRPARTSDRTTPRTVLRDFGWPGPSGTLTGKSPNAALSISGAPTQVFEIRRATVTKNKVTLFVRGLNGPLAATRGSGAIFIDDASGAQTTAVSSTVIADANYNPQGPSISITFESNGITLWSGTLTPTNTSATVPSSSEGATTLSGSVTAEFSGTGAQVLFTGTVTDSGTPDQVVGLLIGSWSDS